jgi:ABC-2 type transport system permease protein
LSSGSLFTLSKETKKVAKALDDDITIYYMVQEGDEYSYIDNVLKQYKKISDHITVKKVDPVVNPGFASKQGIDDEVSSNDVIVVNNETKSAKYLANTELYYSDYDYTTGSSTYYLDVEGQVTSAIQSVAATEKPKLYIMTKHSEQSIGDTLQEALEKMNIDTEELELAKQESVPEDCDILLINGPQTDLTDAEKDMVLDYLQAGGAAMITLSYTTEETPNFDEILEEYGISETKGIMIEGAGNYATSITYIVPSVSSSSELLSDVDGYIIFPYAAGLTQADSDSLRENVTVTSLLETSDSSYVKVDPSSENAEKEKGDVDGPFSVGMSVTEELDDDKETKLIVYSSSYAFTEDMTYSSQIENANVFKKSISSLTTSTVKEVSIDKKDLSYSYISVTPAMQMFWAAVVIIIIPAALLIAGFAIWFVRRRK